MKKKYLLLLSCFSIILLTSCGIIKDYTNNEIYNKSYDVNISVDDIEEGFSYAVLKANESVVGISVFEKNGYTIFSEYQEKSTGSGVIYSCEAKLSNGAVSECPATKDSKNVKEYTYRTITNYHVVESTTLSRRFAVFLGEQNIMIDATLLGYNKKNDLAVLEFKSSIYITPITIADSEKIKAGNFVISIGNPNGHEYYSSATLGIVSYPKRYMSIDTDSDNISDYETEFIQHDSAINPGNSGGALINIKGELIGINRLKLLDEEIDNMGFAIPSNLIIKLLPLLEKGLAYNRIKLGITVYEVEKLKKKDLYSEYKLPNVVIDNKIDYGLYIYNVEKNSLSSNSLEVGDIILSINNQLIYRTSQFASCLDEYSNEIISLLIYRNGKEVTVDIKI